MNTEKGIAIACFTGATLGAVLALQWGYFWWIGVFVGGAAAYFSFRFREGMVAARRVWQSLTRPKAAAVASRDLEFGARDGGRDCLAVLRRLDSHHDRWGGDVTGGWGGAILQRTRPVQPGGRGERRGAVLGRGRRWRCFLQSFWLCLAFCLRPATAKPPAALS